MPQIMDTPGVPKEVRPSSRLPRTKAAHGSTRPSRPKIKDIGGGQVEITGYHATKKPEGWTPHGDYEMHMGTQKAALDRMLEPAANDTGSSAPWKMKPAEGHGMYKVTARMPREAVLGLRKGVSDVDANSLGGIRRGFSPSNAVIEKYPGEVPGVLTGKTKAIGYDNLYEDPGSRSWVITDPSSISSVSRIYDAGSSVLGWAGLANQLSALLGGPSIQTPADWIVQYNMQNLDASPWNPKNQMGYSVPA